MSLVYTFSGEKILKVYETELVIEPRSFFVEKAI